ncbi:hypothetical protein P691DRAFT_769258 [Macrolepiota fuliginosa MF-IS2]|uniref:Uncharacterized protein n=1 Tax=Macrolepiota fuliginosa MF-IS2 TaxID=1400762 RepID=A0A9P5WXR1_9AGAR|nr:hypothetical protein P691DRAFT_769258 [Macrolepiota fuliginosa MF-IS2]
MDDIFELKEKNLKHIYLVYLSPPPSMSLVQNVLVTWPMLEHLYIVPADPEIEWDLGSLLSAGPALGTCLRKLCLPLSLRSLAAASTTLPPFKAPLHTLTLCNAGDIPGGQKEKHAIARNLITLFPRLIVIETVSAQNDSCGHIRDLQVIIDALRDCITFPPSRPDFLYC